MKIIILIISCLLYSCAGTQCVSQTDKHIKGQRHKYTVNTSKCPKQGKYHKWLFIFPAKKY